MQLAVKVILCAGLAFATLPVTEAFPQTTQSVQSMTAPPSGGIFCQDADDIIRIATKKPPVSKCGVIPPGTEFKAGGVQEKFGMLGGIGIGNAINGGEPFAFLIVKATQEPQTPRKDFSERAFKTISPRDVRNTPDKWIGRDIEMRSVQVYWVADDDVRFITDANLTVFGKQVAGHDISFLRENCETEREALSSKCRASIRFSYNYHSEDNPGGLAKRTVIVTSDIQVLRRKRQ